MLRWLLLASALSLPLPAFAQQNFVAQTTGSVPSTVNLGTIPPTCVYTGLSSLNIGQAIPLPCNSSGQLLTSGGGGGGGGAVTVANGADVALGATTDAAYAGSGSATTVAIQKGIYNALVAALPAGSNIIGKVGIDQTTPGTTNGVVINSGSASITGTVATQPVARTKAQTSALASNLVVTNAAGNLYDINITADSTLYAAEWWILIFDATSAPADGAVTPARCVDMPALSRTYERGFANPLAFTTGIVVVVSTTGCFTKTASAHAFIAGAY